MLVLLFYYLLHYTAALGNKLRNRDIGTLKNVAAKFLGRDALIKFKTTIKATIKFKTTIKA